MKSTKRLLGIVIYDQTISVAEIEHRDGSITVCKCAEYSLPKVVTEENVSLDGIGFKSFLKEHKFRTKQAVVGISAKHMISTLMELPRISDPNVRHNTIRINLEQKMEVDLSEIVFDYFDAQQDSNGRILILMLLKKILNQVKDLLKEAKINPVLITNTSLAFDLTVHSGTTCQVIEYPSSFELCLFRNNCLFLVQRIAKSTEQRLSSDLAQKIVRQINRTCLSTGITDSVQYCVYGVDDKSLLENQQLQGTFGEFEYTTLKSSSDSPLCAMAIQLAQQAMMGSSDRINFLNGKHNEAKPAYLSQWLRKGVAVAAGFLVLIGIFFAGWHSDRRKIADYRQQLDSMAANVKVAQKMIDQVSYARGWFQQEPIFLEILRELTLSFPESSEIWLTSLAVDKSLNQILTGRTVTEDAVLDVAETLRSKDAFNDIKILYIRKMGKGSDIMTFAISLQYRKDL